jgi:hypothetical protein
MVGARGFEPPTSWSRTTSQQEINNLAEFPRIDNCFHKLFDVRQLQSKARVPINREQCFHAGVGTKLGTVFNHHGEGRSHAYNFGFALGVHWCILVT